MNFGIRRAIAADWPAVRHLHERAVAHELSFVDNADRPRMATLQHVFRGDLWVAEAAGWICGFVACVGTDVAWLYVDPSRFRQGVGRALLRVAVAHCGAIVTARVLAENVACLGLMASEGFLAAGIETVSIASHGEVQVQVVRRVNLVVERRSTREAPPMPMPMPLPVR